MDKNRIANAHTPLGPTLMFRHLTGREEMSQLFELQLELLANKSASIQPSALLGKDITIELEIQGGGSRFLNGQVTRFAFVGKEIANDTDYWRYEARLRPWLWYLTRSSDCRIWQKKTVPEILDDVFGKYPFPVMKKLEGSYRQWEYCVQYRETDFNFVCRLMEHEGIYYYFQHEMGRHTLVLADAIGAHKPVPGYASVPYIPQDRVAVADEECVDDWQIAQDVEPGAFYHDDYDFEKPSAELDQPRQNPFEHPHGAYEIYEWPGDYTAMGDGENYARIRLEELQAPHETVAGQSNVRGIAPGYLFTLKKCPRADQNREYLILGASYYVRDNPYHTGGEGEGAEWRMCLTAQPSNVPYRPPRVTPKPLTYGPQTAVVVGPAGEEIWCDKYGRVKVQFHWDRYGKHDDKSSCWIRVSHPWAGSNWGGMYMPRIGQEVIVDFINGDPDCPIITGRVYNAEHMPPYELPKYQEYSTLKSHSTKKGSSMDWNELRYVDYKGKEQVFIHANWRMDVRVKWNMYETIQESRYTCIGKEYALTVGGSNDHHVKADYIFEFNGKQEGTIDKTYLVGVEGDAGLIAKGKLDLYSGKSVTVEAVNSIVLKVGANFIEISPAGVTIQGTLVKINSGGGAAGVPNPEYDGVLDCIPADTGEPGYLDRPYKGGGGGRKKKKWNLEHAPPFTVTKLPNGDLKLGNGLTIKQDPSDPSFQDKALRDLTKISSTESGSKTLNGIDQSGKQVTIGPHNPADPQNETVDKNFKDSAPAGPTFFRNSKGEKVPYEGTGNGSDSDIHWKPDDGKTMSNGKERPSDVSLQHELSHADHMANGQRDTTDSTAPGFPDKEEQATIKQDNEYRKERDPTGKDIPQRKNHGDLG